MAVTYRERYHRREFSAKFDDGANKSWSPAARARPGLAARAYPALSLFGNSAASTSQLDACDAPAVNQSRLDFTACKTFG
jgi:hypothetical protein